MSPAPRRTARACRASCSTQRDDPEQTEKVPIEGGEVVVYEAELAPDGRSIVAVGAEVVGAATSDAEGTFSIDLPAPGDYAVELQIDTLPEGVALVDEDRQQLPLRLDRQPAQERAVQPRRGRSRRLPAPQGASDYDRGARLFVEGIKFGLIIGMCAVGLSLIYGTTGLVNFAHAEMITLGAVLAFFFNVTLGIHLLIAAPLAMVVGGLLGAGFDLGIWRPLRRRGVGLVAMMIISIGLAIVLRYAILYQFGDRSRPFDDYAVQTEPLIDDRARWR